jgi:hypothetical protein
MGAPPAGWLVRGEVRGALAGICALAPFQNREGCGTPIYG